jgi:Diadenosine tetraphosphate (Ap4A) hydrolase and other HIT family hydrolases
MGLSMSSDQSCLFCRISRGEIPATIVHQDEVSFAIRDISPQAPTHILVIPREHKQNITEVDDEKLMGQLFKRAAAITREEKLEKGFRLVVNTGEDGGQSVGHLHIHILGGRSLSWPPG